MLYGDGDCVIIGDDVISFVFLLFIIVYVGDGFNDGFNYVVVSNILIYILCMLYRFI